MAWRKEVFGHDLGWDLLGADGIDRDGIDYESTHFYLIEGNGSVVGSIWVTPATARRWMLDMPPFSDPIDHGLDPDYPRAQSAESPASARLDSRGRTCVACLDLAEAHVHMAQGAQRFWNGTTSVSRCPIGLCAWGAWPASRWLANEPQAAR